MDTKYPDIEVIADLSGPDGNSFVIMGMVTRAMKIGLRENYGMDPKEIQKVCEDFRKEATSGDYNNLLEVCKSYVFCTFYDGSY